jgi:UDP-glucose:(heptosyl)LPS alpha-1,3-glucosyltransferase
MILKKLKFIRANKTKHGGAEVYLLRLSDSLNEKGIDHEVINSSIPKAFPSWLRVMLFNLYVCVFKKGSFYFSLERISCPDIYRAGDGVHKVFMKIEKKSSLNPLHFIYQYLEKKTFNNSKKIIANSNLIKNQIIDTYGIDPNKIEVVYNGVPLKEKVDFISLKKEFNLKNEKIILYVGSGFKRKGVKEALEIVSRLKYDFKFIIVGKEKKIKHYENYANELKIKDKVIFTGARDDVDKFYSMSDIFLFPTRYEPFSNVILEAMSYENVVITTLQNGASEILEDKFCMKNSIDFTIVDLIDKLLSNNEYLNKIKSLNNQKVKEFSIENNVNQTLKIIEDLI